MESQGESPDAKAKDADSWVRDYGDRLFRYAMMRVRNRELAEDLVQETLLSAVRAKSGFEGRSSVYTWMVTILKNKIIDHARKHGKAVTVSIDDDAREERSDLFNRLGLWKVDFDEWDGGVETLLMQRDFRRQVESCLMKLPDNLRQVFVLKVMDDMTSEEICDSMQITPNNLWVMLYRSRMRLRKCLEVNWFGKAGSK